MSVKLKKLKKLKKLLYEITMLHKYILNKLTNESQYSDWQIKLNNLD